MNFSKRTYKCFFWANCSHFNNIIVIVIVKCIARWVDTISPIPIAIDCSIVTFLCKSVRHLELSKLEIFGLQPSLRTDFRTKFRANRTNHCAAIDKNMFTTCNMFTTSVISDFEILGFGDMSFIIVPISYKIQWLQYLRHLRAVLNL